MADQRPADDDSIPAEELLYIRIYPGPDSIIAVEGGHRPTTGGVKGRDPDEPLSCDRGSVCTPEQTRDRGTNGNFHVAVITAEAIRGLGLRITREPVVNGPVPNPAHALIYGTRPNIQKNLRGALTGGEYSKIARNARIVLYAPQ